VRYLPVIVAVAALAGCGGSDSGGPARDGTTAAQRPARRAPVLVTFQRNGGLAATLDAVLVRADGWTRSDKRYGGAGRRYQDFRLRADTLRQLRAALARLPERPPRAEGGGQRRATYLLRYRGTTYIAHDGAVPRAMRPAVRTLQAIVDGGGRSGRVREVEQAPS
jgi:hypothetical protein